MRLDTGIVMILRYLLLLLLSPIFIVVMMVVCPLMLLDYILQGGFVSAVYLLTRTRIDK